MSPYFKRLINHTELIFLKKVKCTKFPVRCMTLENTGCTVKKTLCL